MAESLPDLLTLVSHALAALLFAALTLWVLRAPGLREQATPLTIGFALTALWALAVAGLGNGEGITRLLDMGRNLAWLGFIWRIRPPVSQRGTLRATRSFHLAVAVVFVLGGLLGAAGEFITRAEVAQPLIHAGVIVRLLAVIAGLVLVQNAHAGSTIARTRTMALAVAAIWLVDLNVLTLVWATGGWPSPMLAVRGTVMVGVAAVFAVALHREGERPVQLSRTVAVQSLSLLAVLSYFAIFAGVTEALAALGGRHGRLVQTAFVFGTTAATLAILSSPKLRAWLRVKATKHLFRHRYDYRAEWMRFTATLGRHDDATPLGARAVRAMAELVDAPAGALLIMRDGRFEMDAVWRWEDVPPPPPNDDSRLVEHLSATGRIVELDEVRASRASPDAPSVPEWLIRATDAWALVPLPHADGLVGAIVLARPLVVRALDWEDFDLLKVAGRQAASAIAEARAQGRLAEGERFDEFNRRFAFILHDIKNLVSQLSLVARNAERHADNPAFRADMVVTLNESATRLNELVARLSQARSPQPDTPRAVAPVAIAREIASECRLTQRIDVVGEDGILALADTAGLTQILRHLVQNAVEASEPDAPIQITVIGEAYRVHVDVIDQGHGMSAAFIREQLFRPFVSTKAAGFGIGAYEARALALAMGGTLNVVSREGEGTRFRLSLPPAQSLERAA